MPVKEPNLKIEQLKEHLLQTFFSSLTQDQRQVGLELELIPFRPLSEGVQTLPLLTEEKTGVIDWFRKELSSYFNDVTTPDVAGRFVDQAGGQITFEPGGQIEYSSSAKTSLHEVVQDMNQAFYGIEKMLNGHGASFFYSGINPYHTIEEVGLHLKKDRYINMDRYFNAIGPFGQKMMRLSSSLQINLDVGYVGQARRRWLGANLLAPIFCAGFGNSPFQAGQSTGFKSFRSKIWQSLDPSRTGFQKGIEAVVYEPCPIHQYLEFALDATCMWLPIGENQVGFDGHFRSFRHWMQSGFHGYFPDFEDWKKHLSTLFPEVRPRGFYEIRFLDGQPRAFWMVPGVLLFHLLYDEDALEEVIQLLEPYRSTLSAMLMEAAMQGMSEPDLAKSVKKVFQIALKAAEGKENAELLHTAHVFYEHLTARDKSPADELLSLNKGKVFQYQQFLDLEAAHAELVGKSFKAQV